ncbi:hypothetical protein QBC38DRAFT_451574 [Podospora fimiseda]|uniref:Uncharacterized protein n=1 Tax=Podospora fimiseda TaxID=252190 RepID=A0AAN7H0X7_9PEZI|nr:hypothetical protein QBC38DRAFT_451574 [Podospora fimiseda]
MKFTTVLFSLLATTGLASPVPDTKPKFVSLYSLKLSSRSKTLDGKYLSIVGSTVGVTSSPTAETVKFYPIRNPESNLWELRQSPATTTQSLALLGSNGLLELSSLPNPAAVTVPTGTTLEWKGFDLADGPETETGALGYAGKVGGWVVFPEGKDAWTVKWKDASAITIQNYQTVSLVYEKAKEY